MAEHYPTPLVSHVKPLVFLALNQKCEEDHELEKNIFSHLSTASLVKVKVIGKTELEVGNNVATEKTYPSENTERDAEEQTTTQPSTQAIKQNVNTNADSTILSNTDPNDPLNENDPNSLSSAKANPLQTPAEQSNSLNDQDFLEGLEDEIGGANARYTYYMDSLSIPSAPSRMSYYNYKPKGILPRAWMFKVSEQIPSVVILGGCINDLQDFDQILQGIKIIRDSNRPTRIAVIIKKGNLTLDTEANTIFDQRLKEIKLSIENKLTFVLQSPSDNLTYLGLSRNIHDTSISYYKESIKRLKLQPNTTSFLNVRIYFKMAYLEEIIANRKKAFDYYTRAYNELMNVSTEQYSEREIKILSDYICFKMYSIKIKSKKIDLAVQIFIKHLGWFSARQSEGTKKTYEHYYLLYRQNRMFATLLKESVKISELNDTSDNQRYKIPAYYYHAAAEAAKERRYHVERLILQYQDLVTNLYNLDGTEKLKIDLNEEGKSFEVDNSVSVRSALPYDLHLDEEICSIDGFIGQEVTYLSTEEKRLLEQSGIPNIRQIARELIFDHSATIQSMLTSAFNDFKPYERRVENGLRLILYNLAIEYERTENWKRAFDCFENVAACYKEHMWYDLLTDTLRHAYKCAKAMKDPRKIIPVQLPLLSTKLSTSREEKEEMWKELVNYFSEESTSSLERLTKPQIIYYRPKDVLFNLKAYFSTPNAEIYSEKALKISIHSTATFPLQFSRLQISFHNSRYDICLWESDVDLLIRPEATNIITIPIVFKEPREITINSVSLYMGKHPHSVCLQWNHFKFLVDREYEFQNQYDSTVVEKRYPVLKVTNPVPKLLFHFKHLPPAIVGEFYCIKIIAEANGEYVKGGTIDFDLNSENVKIYNQDKTNITYLDIGEIQATSSQEYNIYVQFLTPLSANLSFKAKYDTNIAMNLIAESGFILQCIEPYSIALDIHPMRSSTSDASILLESSSSWPNTTSTPLILYSSFPTLFSVTLKCATHYKTILRSVRFIENQSISNIPCVCLGVNYYLFTANDVLPMINDQVSSLQLNEALILSHDDEVTIHFMVQADNLPIHTASPTVPGSLVIECGRADAEREMVPYSITLPTVEVHSSPVNVTVDIPDSCKVYETFEVKLLLHNNTSSLQKVDLEAEESTSFFVNGTIHQSLDMLPFESHELRYIFSPVKTGFLYIPKIQINVNGKDSLLHSKEEWKIFVKDL